MNNVICIAAARAERLKQALSVHARNGDTVIIGTRNGTITAEKITCRGGFAEVLNSRGEYFVVDYADLRSLRPAAVAQTSVVTVHGDFRPIHTAAVAQPAVAVLPFTQRARRR